MMWRLNGEGNWVESGPYQPPPGSMVFDSRSVDTAFVTESKLKATHIELGGVDYTPDPRLCFHGQRSGVCCSCRPW